VAIIMLPIGVLIALRRDARARLNSNIMSLGGIAIAIGAMVDAAIVMIENAHKHLERMQPGGSRLEAIIAACREVGPRCFFSLLIITVSFCRYSRWRHRRAVYSRRLPTPRPSPWPVRRCSRSRWCRC